jgi:hypothetical protein
MDVFRDLRTWHRPLVLLTVLMAASLLLSAGGLLVDDRTLLGEPIWLKPVKFSVSIGIYTVTLAWLISLLRKRTRTIWWLGTISAVALVVEMVVIIGQVLRGRSSHFNNATDLDSTLFTVMGASIVVLWVANVVIGVLVLRERFADAPTLWAIRIGLLVALAGMAVAFMMPSPTEAQMAIENAGGRASMIGAHSVGVADGGPGMPLTHWSTTGGDLRIPHFLGIHALQALPLLAMFLRRFSGHAVVVQTRLVFVGAAAYVGLFGLVTWQALRGQALIHPDGLTLGVFVLVVTASAVAATAVLRAGTREEALV